jgi:hypothetical protein
MITAKPKESANGNGVFSPNGTVKHPAGAPLDAVIDGAPPAQPKTPAEQPAASGHDAKGRFAPGNKCARGNPFARRMAELRSALLESATPERLKKLGERLYREAVGDRYSAPDLEAAKLWLTYCVGRPVEVINPDRLDLDEFRLLDESPTSANVVRVMVDTVPALLASEFIGDMVPNDLKAAEGKILKKDGDGGDLMLCEQVLAERKARVGRKS